MKRKLIKIGDSTLLLSVPREWVIKNNLSKGDEIEYNMDQDKLTFWCNSKASKEKLSIEVTGLNDMLPRLLFAIYKGGYDEVELRSKDPALIDKVKSFIWKEAVGFEILDQGIDRCTIVNVSGKMEDFHNVLRRLFLLTMTMSVECAEAAKKGKTMEGILYLEQENNRLATMLIRSINKHGSFGYKKIGPLYYIVQELERIGDQYKFMIQNLEAKKNKKISLAATRNMEETAKLFRMVYELFYNYHLDKIPEIRNLRDKIIDRIIQNEAKNEDDLWINQQILNIVSRVFDTMTSLTILRITE